MWLYGDEDTNRSSQCLARIARESAGICAPCKFKLRFLEHGPAAGVLQVRRAPDGCHDGSRRHLFQRRPRACQNLTSSIVTNREMGTRYEYRIQKVRKKMNHCATLLV